MYFNKDIEKKSVERCRIIMAREIGCPPDDIDMEAIVTCIKRAIEEKVDKNLLEPVLSPTGAREIHAVIGEIGETVALSIFHNKYPFLNFVKEYEISYKNRRDSHDQSRNFRNKNFSGPFYRGSSGFDNSDRQ